MAAETYTNPVYPRSFPDPFVLKHAGEYWAYCTGFWHDGGCFGILRSPDLIAWEPVGSAMQPLPGGHTCYWAPEVAYIDGRFYLYYSVGNETTMQVRVAVADAPGGPFEDSGVRLTHEDFAIDAHPFQDVDGRWYLFYATDYLDYERIGTGTAVDRLIDPFHLAGEARPVTRAAYDWQVYDPARKEKGGVRWHTVEGPFVLLHKRRYYQMFSGGNWQNITYGVGYAVSDHPLRDGEWEQRCDGDVRLPVLRTLPERGVIGPGHNSVVRGPDNRQLFCVYHRWMPTPDNGQEGRVLAIDRLEWVGERLVVLGPSTTPQPAPLKPCAWFKPDKEHEQASPPEMWELHGGEWQMQSGRLVQSAAQPGRLSEARLTLSPGPFLLEAGLQGLEDRPRNPGAFGLLLESAREELFSLDFIPSTRPRGRTNAYLAWGAGERRRETLLPLPPGFLPHRLHTVRLELSGSFARLGLDGLPLWRSLLPGLPERLVLFTRGLSAAFSSLELTWGYEDLFESPTPALVDLGWQGEGRWSVEAGRLRQLDSSTPSAHLLKPAAAFSDYELVVNARLEAGHPLGGYGFYPAVPAVGLAQALKLSLIPYEDRWALSPGPSQPPILLPTGFDPREDQQFRFLKQGSRLRLSWVALDGAVDLGELPVPAGDCSVGLWVGQSSASFDLVRLTALMASAHG